MKDLQIFEDTNKKTFTTLPDFERKPTFESFLAIDQDGNSSESDDTIIDKPRPTENSKSQSGYTLRYTAKAKKRKNVRQKWQKISSTNNLIIQLSKLLKINWKDLASTKTFVTNCSESNEEDKSTSTNLDPYKILAAKLIFKTNTQNQD